MRRRRRIAAATVGVVVLAAVAYSQYWVATGRIGTVEEGRLYRSAALPADALIGFARQHRITAVVDFRKTSDETRAEAAALAGAGIRHIEIPSGQVPTPDSVARFLTVMDETPNEAVLIHCTHGVGRTGVFSAIYRMEFQGWSRRRALLEAMLYSGFGSFGPGNAKAEFLANYVPRAPNGRR